MPLSNIMNPQAPFQNQNGWPIPYKEKLENALFSGPLDPVGAAAEDPPFEPQDVSQLPMVPNTLNSVPPGSMPLPSATFSSPYDASIDHPPPNTVSIDQNPVFPTMPSLSAPALAGPSQTKLTHYLYSTPAVDPPQMNNWEQPVAEAPNNSAFGAQQSYSSSALTALQSNAMELSMMCDFPMMESSSAPAFARLDSFMNLQFYNPAASDLATQPLINEQEPTLQDERKGSWPVYLAIPSYASRSHPLAMQTPGVSASAFPQYPSTRSTHDSPDSRALTASNHSRSESITSPLVEEHTPVSSTACRVVRGVAQGGCSIKPPEERPREGRVFERVKLQFSGDLIESICNSSWNNAELMDGRRIVRIERTQDNNIVNANLSVVGCANDFPTPAPARPNTDFIEVSCLAVFGMVPGFYITSVEVVGIVEMLIGTRTIKDSALRRRERGRVRSNLMSFWSKNSYHSRSNEASLSDFAKRIMAYDIRKPRGFDKGFRILSWDKLIPALQRALQCYYAEIPVDDGSPAIKIKAETAYPTMESPKIKTEEEGGYERFLNPLY